MAEFPIFPVRTALLLSDTYNMDSAEFGAYVRILLAMWQNGGWLYAADLQKFSGLSQYKWRNSNIKISRLLTFVEGTVSQKRLTDTYLKVKARRANGAVAARHRWGHAKALPNGMPTPMPKPYQTDATKTKKERESSLTDSSEHVAPQQEGATEEAVNGARPEPPPKPTAAELLRASPEMAAAIRRQMRH